MLITIIFLCAEIPRKITIMFMYYNFVCCLVCVMFGWLDFSFALLAFFISSARLLPFRSFVCCFACVLNPVCMHWPVPFRSSFRSRRPIFFGWVPRTRPVSSKRFSPYAYIVYMWAISSEPISFCRSLFFKATLKIVNSNQRSQHISNDP